MISATMTRRLQSTGNDSLKIAAFLALLSLLLVVFPTSAALFAVVIGIATLSTGHQVWRFSTRASEIRFLTTMAISIQLGYVLGTAVYLINCGSIQLTHYQPLQPYGVYFDQHSLGLALAAVLMACALLHAASGWEKPKALQDFAGQLASPKAERLVWCGALLALVALASGDIGFMGSTVSDTSRISALGGVAALIIPPLVPYTLALATGNRPLPRRVALWACELMFVGITLVLGRRYLIYVVLLSILAFFIHERRFTLRKRINFTVAGVATLLVMYWGFKFFMALRFAGWEAGSEISLGQRVDDAIAMLGDNRARMISDALSENAGTRTFILGYMAALMGIDGHSVPTLGQELIYSVKMAIPSLLLPGKTASLPAAPEEFIHPLYGIPNFDGPNSVIVAGYDDFGFIGAVLYPLAVAMLYAGFFYVVKRLVRHGALRVFFVFALLFSLLYVEQALAGPFVTLRNLLIVSGGGWLLMRIPVIRVRRDRRRFPGGAHALHGLTSSLRASGSRPAAIDRASNSVDIASPTRQEHL